jgi:Kef-type K+ transport system membrane component KefB
VSFGTLALIGLCAFGGPLLSFASGGLVPVVVGEIIAGVLIGRTGLRAVDPSNATLTFLGDVGFAMLMLNAGLNVPLRDPQLRVSLGRGARAAALVGSLGVGAGFVLALIGGAGHPFLYAVIVASGSAAIVLPVVQERRLRGEAVLTVIAQVTVADIAATVAIPFVLAPGQAARVAGGTALVAASVLGFFALSRLLRGSVTVRSFRRQGKRHRWAIDLRVALIVLFTLSWIAVRTGASLLIAGFGAGLMVAAVGGPKRLSTEVLGIAGGFFVPLFFVLLGARIDLRGVIRDPALIGLTFAIVALTTGVHVLGARLTRQPRAAGLLASAQLGVPSAIVALGLPAHVITPAQGAAIIAAALISLAVSSAGAALLASRAEREAASAP